MASDFLTLFTDASFHLESQSAGWGAWAIRDDWERSDIFGASIPIAITSVNDAETFAISAALTLLDKRGDLKDISMFSLQSDNVHALGVLLALCPRARISRVRATRAHITAIQNPTVLQRECAKTITQLVARRPIYLKHVKGHNSDGTGRSWVNARCDEVAGRYMREVRETRKGKING